MSPEEEKFQRMTTRPVGQLICELAVPCIISMMITAFYNLADTFFVGMLHSNSATGAVGVAFSLMAIIQAVGFFFGHGSGNYMSRELGQQNHEEASKMAATGFFLSLCTGGILLVLGILFLKPLVLLLGSTETILPYATRYVRIILIGTPWMTTALTLNNQLRFQGSAAYGMIGITAGGVLNIILDPILIFTCGLGISGAALATIISQFISFCILLRMTYRKGNIAILPAKTTLKVEYFSQIIQGGLPSLFRQGLASLATIALNRAAGLYGDAAIAAMAVVTRIMMMANSAMIGFGQGFQPVCGFNYGAKLWKRVRQGFLFCVKTSSSLLVLAAIGISIFAPQIVALFRNDPTVIAIGAPALRYQCITFALGGLVVMSNMMLQTIGRTLPATVLAVARQGIYLIPALWVLTPLLGLQGVQIAQPIADILSFLTALPISWSVLREMREDPVG